MTFFQRQISKCRRVMVLIITACSLLTTNSVHAQKNAAAARYEIDAKRAGVSPVDKDALPRSREFIRLDSTYYVGHMYEGLYKADKSSDIIGFRNAIPSIRKAFTLFEKDFGNNMKLLFSSTQMYMQYMNKYADFLQIANSLRECYDNLEMADSVMWVLNKVESYNFPKEHLYTTTNKAWTYHRNRFFTSEKFAFLKNTVEENERMAFQQCYNALGKIDFYEGFNNGWFGMGQGEADRLNVYHYLALLHCYNKNYDSSEYYYQRMMAGGGISWNNYANMQHELGSFSTATEYFERDKYRFFEKNLREPFYYLPMLDIYAGRTKQAMNTAKEAIEGAGSTPGFGWYNIALGRGYLYDGQLDSAEYALNKAAHFREIHIGTTLTQNQYDFTVNLLRLQLIEKKIGLEKFMNKGWWYSPASLYNIARLKIEKILSQYVLINQLSVNPERERIVYDLFCAESTTSFDEAMCLIKDFSPTYFIRKFGTYEKEDPRKNVTRYFKLAKYQMEWSDGDEGDALNGYQQLIKEVIIDTANEKLFMGRLYEGLCKGYHDRNNTTDFDFYSNAFYEQYPQLMPFANLKTKMKLTSGGTQDETTQKVLAEIKSCNINFVDDSDNNTPVANVSFNKRGDKYEVLINVRSGSQKPVVTNEKLIFKATKGVGKEIALRLFGKGGALTFEKAPQSDSNS